MALARVSGRDESHRKPTDPPPDPALRGRILAALDAIDWSRLGRSDRVDLLRAYALAFMRLGRPDDEACRRLAAKFDPLFPARALEVDFLLAEILAYLQAPTAAAKIMAALREATTQEEQIHYALVLRGLKAGWTRPLARGVLPLVRHRRPRPTGAATPSPARCGRSRPRRWQTLSDDERAALKPILDAQPAQRSPRELLAARKPVKEWTVAELVPIVERGLSGGATWSAAAGSTARSPAPPATASAGRAGASAPTSN